MTESRVELLTASMMTPMERAAGRFMRAPDHPGAGGEPVAGGDNTGVIPPAGGAAAESGADNAGTQIDPEAFWKAGTEENPGDPSAEGRELATQLSSSLTNMTFGEAVINDSIAKEMAEGNYETFNQRLTEHSRQVARQTLAANLHVLKAVEAQIMRKADERISAVLGKRDNKADLLKEIPSAGNPAVRPHIEKIYDQALVNSKGDTKAAMAMTKTMARMLVESAAGDVGLNLAPGNPGDSAPAPKVNWMDELMGRQ